MKATLKTSDHHKARLATLIGSIINHPTMEGYYDGDRNELHINGRCKNLQCNYIVAVDGSYWRYDGDRRVFGQMPWFSILELDNIDGLASAAGIIETKHGKSTIGSWIARYPDYSPRLTTLIKETSHVE